MHEGTDPSFEGDPPVAANPSVLPDRRELALVAVERTRMPMVVTDPRQPDNPIVLANQAFLDLTGYAADEVIGRNCRFLQGPDTAPEDVAAIRQALTNGTEHVSVELLNYRKDGSAFWNQLAISPVLDAGGTLLYYFGSQKDVTARRRAQDQEVTERLLLKEVDHRAMNALALVQSIVRLSRSDTIEHFSAAVIGRVDALARAHRLLAAEGWAGAELADLIRMETGRLVIDAEGPATMLPANWVQPLTLLFHELVSNARRHGACRDGRGTLVVRWENRPDQFVLDWTERHARLRAGVPKPGLGLNLVRGIAERQLDGSLVVEWLPQGLRVEIAIPWPRGGPAG